MSLRRAYPIVRINFVTVFNTFIAVYRHANCLDEFTSHRDTFDVTRDVNAMTCCQIVSVVMKRTCVLINIRKMTVVSSTVSRDIQHTSTLGLTDPVRMPVLQTEREFRRVKQQCAGLGESRYSAYRSFGASREFLVVFSSIMGSNLKWKYPPFPEDGLTQDVTTPKN